MGAILFATGFSETSTVLFFVHLHGNLQMLAQGLAGKAWLAGPVPSPDSHYLAYRKRTDESNVMMLEHF
jgi:hypothetical protein